MGQGKVLREMSVDRHVVFMNIASSGHINPTLPLAARLRKAGCRVSYFVDTAMQAVVEAAGAAWYPYRWSDSREVMDLGVCMRTLHERGVAKYVAEGVAEE